MRVYVCVRVSKEEGSMTANCTGPSQMIPEVQSRTQTQRYGKRKTPFLFLNVWEVDLPQKVGPQEKKGVFLSFMLGSSYESGLALESTP